MTQSERRIVILAEGTLDFHHGKTAVSILRYRPDDVIAVVDSTNAGRTTGDVLGLAGMTPIVADVTDVLGRKPTELLIGIAPRGGGLPQEWRRQILAAISTGVDVVSGLHYMLSEDEEFSRAAAEHGAQLVDVRRPPPPTNVAEMTPRRPGSTVVTFVGSDCAVGKMTAALEMNKAARERGLNTAFVATGQTGIMLEGSGIAIDRVIGDFMAGAIEELVVDAAQKADYVFVEGQGSLLHPAYSSVTLALLHGSLPDALILVHPPARRVIDEYDIPIPPLPRLIEIYEEAMGWVRPARVVGIALNTRDLDDEATRRAIEDAERDTSLPTTDPIKFGGGKLVEAITRVRTAGV